MGATAERAQNYEEAISYYNRVLEADPTIGAAWLGKGRAAGRLSTLAHVRINETIVLFSHAIATAGDGEKGAVAERAVADLTILVESLYDAARRHFEEHGAADGVRRTYLTVSAQLIDALSEVRSWVPDHRSALEATVRISCALLHQDLEPDMAAMCWGRLRAANAAMLAQDPDYVAPALTEEGLAQQRAEAARVAVAKASDQAQQMFALWFFIIAFAVIGGMMVAS